MHSLDGMIEIMCRLKQALQKDEVIVFFYAEEERRRRLSWYGIALHWEYHYITHTRAGMGWLGVCGCGLCP